MKVFNLETQTKQTECVLVLDKKDAQLLCAIAEEAAKQNPRKKTWRRVADQFDAELGCW